MIFQKCAVIGLGLIGGSFAAGIKAKALVGQVNAYTPREDHLRIAEHLEYIDQGYSDIQSCVKDADLVVIAVPVAAFESVFQALSELPENWLAPNVVVTDVGSVKGSVIALANQYIPDLQFVPGHPIAGSEKSGILAVNPSLYEKHMVVITESSSGKQSASSRDKVKQLWEGVGALVKTMPVEEHDRIFAVTSHLPHLLAFSLVDTLAGDPAQQAIFQFAAGGFRDFTRIAASDPVMWHDIFFANKENMLSAIDEFSEGLNALRGALETDNHEGIMGILTRSQAARQHFQVILEQRAFSSLEKQSKESSKDMSETHVQHFLLQPGGQCSGEITIPGDKSMSHRSIMFGALSEGTTNVKGFLEGEDALATLQAFRDMGVVIEGPKDGEVVIHGVGLHGLKQPKGEIYVGNSGTTIRLMTGLLGAQQFASRMVGDPTIMKRPMGRVANPVNSMGANITISDAGTPPVVIEPAQGPLKAIHYDMPVVSAQVKSAVLLAALYAEGTTTIKEIGPARDHTERMLKAFGVEVEVDGYNISLKGGQKLVATDFTVPADISSSAFFLVGASIAPNSNLLMKQVGMNPTRTGVIDILKLMGADITLENEQFVGGEPVADIRVKSAQLKGIQIPEELVPLAIDEFPAIFVAASCAEGETKLTGAEELRVKESDRIASMAAGLKTLGIDAEAQPDGIIIQGKGNGDLAAPIFGTGEIETFGDHRIAMSFSMAALRASGTILVKDTGHVATSFPGFKDLAQMTGLNVEITT
ncbi:MAG: bifunctional prephenate dehydrogenase/3-phosphoshikimate 1-carboxyvinyltransferase [Gammaproteobacteria bacterium]|nr:bifunctional prephenate dehydrogenase/3-phosphoshikimate 1-carboxyvinyltransferase [Gammaproteobacteria bacterium]HBF09000.1 bifunctional prephenate dehydrogenase/3-phosphoshikimate 1-carboxyvinyltransferase [Gammaproteobacteria bacterium]